jgi:hypothetical protein
MAVRKLVYAFNLLNKNKKCSHFEIIKTVFKYNGILVFIVKTLIVWVYLTYTL